MTKRNYEKEPIKVGEKIPKDDLYELYIERNLNLLECAKILSCSKSKVSHTVVFYGFRKTREQIKAMMKRLTLEKYGVESTNQLPRTKERKLSTHLERYGASTYLNSKQGSDKIKQSNLLKYGYENAGTTPEAKSKRKQTCIERYGADNPNKNEEVLSKRRDTYQKKYGKDSYFQTEEFKDKSKQTVMTKYGVENISQNSDIKDKKKQTFRTNYNTREKITNLRKRASAKRYVTMWSNNSFPISKSEKVVYDKLCAKFDTVFRSYKTDDYPFECDFFIPEINLFIEYNEHVCHGHHPFDIGSNEDLQTMNLWLRRSQEINILGQKKKAYKGFLTTWIKRDPLKRKTAKENNLNWLEFFTLEEFDEWFEQL